MILHNKTLIVLLFLVSSIFARIFMSGETLSRYSNGDLLPFLHEDEKTFLLTETGSKANSDKSAGFFSGHVVYVVDIQENESSDRFGIVTEYTRIQESAVRVACKSYEDNSSEGNPVFLFDYSWLNTALATDVYYKSGAVTNEYMLELATADSLLSAKGAFTSPVAGLFWVNVKGNGRRLVVILNHSSEIGYAVSTVFSTDAEAKKYGYEKGQRLYPSKPITVYELITGKESEREIYTKVLREFLIYPGKSEDDIDDIEVENLPELYNELRSKGGMLSFMDGGYFRRNMHLAGVKVYTEEEAYNNESNLWWVYSEPVKEITPNDTYLEIVDFEVKDDLDSDVIVRYQIPGLFPKWKNDEIRYIFPIDAYHYNSNTTPLKEVPDMRLFFGLYAQRFYQSFVTDMEESLPMSAGSFSSYKDYARLNMMESVQDTTIYDSRGVPTSMTMSTEQPPEEGYYFTKDCVLINSKSPWGDRTFNPLTSKYFLVEVEKIWHNPPGIAPKNWGRFITRAFPMDLDLLNQVGTPAWNANERNDAGASTTVRSMSDLFSEVTTALKLYTHDVTAFPSNFSVLVPDEYKNTPLYVADPLTLSLLPFADQVNDHYDRDLSVANGGAKPSEQSNLTDLALNYPICRLIETTESDGTIKYHGDQIGLLTYNGVIYSTENAGKFWRQRVSIQSILATAKSTMDMYVDRPQLAMNREYKKPPKNSATLSEEILWSTNGKPVVSFELAANCPDVDDNLNADCNRYYDSTLFIGNASDYGRPFQKTDYIYLYDQNAYELGHPLKVLTEIHDVARKKPRLHDERSVYLDLKYPVMHDEEHAGHIVIGWIRYRKLIVHQKHLIAPPGWEAHTSFKLEEYAPGYGAWFNHYKDKFPLEKKDFTVPSHILIYDEDEEYVDLEGLYEKETKDYYTDQKDLNERDPTIDKGEAIKDIVGKILVAEGLNFVMKGLHYLATKEIKTAPIYETAKRIEGAVMESIWYKIAKETYRAYCIWKTTMDLSAEIRDSYYTVVASLDGLKQSAKAISTFYKEKDWSDLKLTNISSALPGGLIQGFQGHVNHFHNSTNNFALSIDAMAFHSDSTLNGNYGPLNPVLDIITMQLVESLESVGVKASETVEQNTAILERITKNAGKNAKNTAWEASYVSNITAMSQSAIQQVNIDVNNEQVQAMSSALMLIQLESNSWIKYHDHMTSIPGELSTIFSDEDIRKRPYEALANALDYRSDVFAIYATGLLEQHKAKLGVD